ncbi:hypothetical protein NIES592_19600 [Fischerella major NIES-592]|uniref:Uncharacterized protein n=1 Tax=Fischerella major NIES-592 TaxID=210994 RepID=A0A1U7GUZ5_9CYAN|nr:MULTISPECIES: hypothetical protein [Fischerella]OKH11902.1 hypothetical protein NIES592_19600 [Fischerella major NIES-592]BAU08699.1 hypothetical protein FIS3754_46470 [Fischerella sp. NIES-3754]BCX06160.1 MAG: hypothetical protein KatS3mg066_0019 [Fischerella sp.]
MSSGIYAIAHIGDFKLFVGEASKLSQKWPPMLVQLNSGTFPHAMLQQVWNIEGGKRHFSFHTKAEIISDQDILGVEEFLAEAAK